MITELLRTYRLHDRVAFFFYEIWKNFKIARCYQMSSQRFIRHCLPTLARHNAKLSTFIVIRNYNRTFYTLGEVVTS